MDLQAMIGRNKLRRVRALEKHIFDWMNEANS